MWSPTTAPRPRFRRPRPTRRGRSSTRVGRSAPEVLAHGTTVATNALLERRLGRVALVTTRGFADVLEIARQARPSLYDARVDRPAPLVPRGAALRGGRATRRTRSGGRTVRRCRASPSQLAGVDTVAVCLIHADLDLSHEQAVAAIARGRRDRRGLLARGVARVPRVRAHGDDGGRRRAARGVRAVAWPASPAPARRRVGDDVGRWSRAAGRCGRAPSSAPPVGTRRRGACRGRGGGRLRVPRRGRVRHGGHQHRRVPGAGRGARAVRVAHGRRGSRCGCRRSRSTPSAPAADRWRASTQAARWWWDPRARAPIRDPRATGAGHRAHGHRRQPRAGAHPGRYRAARLRSRSTIDAARAALARAGGDRRGRRRGRRRGHGARGACGHGRAGRRPARPRVGRVRRRGTAPRVRDRRPVRDARGHRAAARRGVLCGRPPGVARAARAGAVVARRPVPRRTGRCPGRARRRGPTRWCRAAPSPAGSTVGTRARATSSPWSTSATSPPSTSAATGSIARCGGRGGGAARTRDVAPHRSRSTTFLRSTRAVVVGPRVVAEPDCTVWIPDGWRAEPGPTGAWVVAPHGEPGGAADPRLAVGVDRRRDGRGAAPRRVQPQHQGAGRLLGGAVHRRGRAARAGRAHPGAPRVDARVGRGGDRDRAPVHRWCSTTRSRAAPTSTTSRWCRRSRVDGRAGGVGRHPRAPRRRRRHRARLDAPRRAHHRRGRTAPPAHALRRRGRRPGSSPRRARPTNVAATSTRSGAPTSSALVGSRSSPPALIDLARPRRDPRLRRATHARGDRRAARRPLHLRRRARLRRPPSGAAVADTHRRRGDDRRRPGDVRLHRHRRRSGPATSTRWRR